MMEELDLLKKDWKKNENSFEQISEKEIYGMIHKKSSSIVKWILIISILEFVFLNGIGLILNDKSFDSFMELHPYLNIFDKINYFIVIGFIFLFYKNYKNISVSNSAKKLIEDILKTRKIVNFYIFWNVIIGSFFGAYAMIDGFYKAFNNENSMNSHGFNIGQVIVIVFIMLFIMGFIWLFYKALYGILLNKLTKNYNELKKIDL